MNSSSSDRPASFPANLVPAADFPTRVEVRREAYLRNYPPVEELHFRAVGTAEGSRWVGSVWRSKFLNLPDEAVVRLVAGEKLSVDSVQDLGAGRLELFWWLETKSASPILLFTPLETLGSGVGFTQWKQTRVPYIGCHRYQALLPVLYKLWVAETCPEPGHPSHRDLLHVAVLENDEEFVQAILAQAGRLDRETGPVVQITETPLGIAMENADDLPDEIGFGGGCHRRFRQDDFCEAEDLGTWVARARRIADLLKAAGAVDYSPLLTVCREGDMPAVERMLDAGYPPNFAVYGHATALTNAVRGGHLEVCRLLIARGANPNRPVPYVAEMSSGGEIYPLQLALGNARLSALLIEAGADPAIARDDSDRTPVVFSGGFGSLEAAEAIFRRCRFAEVRNPFGATGVHLLTTDDLQLCREWITPELVNLPDNSGAVPLVEAITNRDLRRAILLLECGADPNRAGIVWENTLGAGGFSILSPGERMALPLLLTPAQTALLTGAPLFLELLVARGARCPRVAIRLDLSYDPDPAALASLRRQLDADGIPEPERGAGDLPISRDFPNLWSPTQGDSLRIIRRVLAGEISPQQFPGLFEEIDVVTVARTAGTKAPMCVAFEKSCGLSARDLLNVASEALSEARQSFRSVSDKLETLGGRLGVREVTRMIRVCELSVNLARLRIAGTKSAAVGRVSEGAIFGMFVSLLSEPPIATSAKEIRRSAVSASSILGKLQSELRELRKRV
jgi:ankyrin repeat protein